MVTEISLMAAGFVIPLAAEDISKLNFDIGGDVSTPLNPAARWVGLSGNFVVGAGYNMDKHNSISGEFMWAGLPPDIFSVILPNARFGNVNLDTLTANYRYKVDRIGQSPWASAEYGTTEGR